MRNGSRASADNDGDTAEQPRWEDLALHELTAGWQRWTSFACIWIWSCLVTRGGLTDAALSQLSGTLSLSNSILLLAAVVTLIVIYFLSDSLSTIVGSRGAMLLSGALLTAGSLLVCASSLTSSLASYAVGASCGGAAIGFLKIAWGEMFSRMSLRAGLADIGFALITSTVTVEILLFAPPAVSRAALILVAPPCAILAVRGTTKLDDEPAPPPPPGAARTISFSWTLLVLPALVALASGLFAGVFGTSIDANPLFWHRSRLGSTVAEFLVGIIMLLTSRFLSKRLGAAQIYSVSILFTVSGLMLAATDAASPWLSYSINDLGFSMFYFFMIVYWGDLARRINRPVVRTYALGYLVFQASQIPGILIGAQLAATGGNTWVALIFTAVVLAFFMVSLLVLNDARSPVRQWLTAGEPAETTDVIPDACAAISERCELSPREREVLSLLARGRTAGYIGKSLGIAPDTAKTHMRSIYRKLDVHTQQELIDMISEEAARQEQA